MRAAKADVAAFGEIHFFRTSPDEVTHKWLFKESVSLSDALIRHGMAGPKRQLPVYERKLGAGREIPRTLPREQER